MTQPEQPSLSQGTLQKLEQHIQHEMLPADFIDTVLTYYLPVVSDVVLAIDQGFSQKPFFLGIHGSQGSGKSTLASFIKLILEQQFGKTCVVMSLDDFYLSKSERKTLSQTTHSLLEVRGVPGTHDVDLLQHSLQSLRDFNEGDLLEIVTFNKALDDRADPVEWQKISEFQDVIILEGWCVGVSAQKNSELLPPINELEKLEDIDASWRTFVNAQIQENYQSIYDTFDGLIMLAAPSFECVFQWRLKQEAKLAKKLRALGLPASYETMNPEQIKRFISHYQRLTEHGLSTLPTKADWILHLLPNHKISQLSRQSS